MSYLDKMSPLRMIDRRGRPLCSPSHNFVDIFDMSAMRMRITPTGFNMKQIIF